MNHYVVARADVPNANNRIYTRKVLDKIVEDFNNMTKDSMIGQMGMPHDSIVKFSLASHIVKKLYVNDNSELVAEVQILNTPCGNQLSELMDIKAVAFRLQGIGEVKNLNGVEVMQDNYKVITINAVLIEEAA